MLVMHTKMAIHSMKRGQKVENKFETRVQYNVIFVWQICVCHFAHSIWKNALFRLPPFDELSRKMDQSIVLVVTLSKLDTIVYKTSRF